MDPTSQFIVPTIIDVPELIVTSEDVDYDDNGHYGGGPFSSDGILMNKIQFLSSALSYAIGLGNVWRFPYLCYKHAGGAFLVAYTLILITVGMPLLLMELAFGQYANEGPITIWRISPAFEGIGYAMCLVSATIALYYNIINTWILHYLLASITFGPLPWASCDNRWNSEHCFYKPDKLIRGTSNNCTIATNANTNSTIIQPSKIGDSSSDPALSDNATLVAASLAYNNILLVPGNCTSPMNLSSSFAFDKVLNTTDEVVLPSNEYFHNSLLELSESPDELGGLNWNFLFSLAFVWFSVFIILLKNLHCPLTNNRQLSLLSLVMPYLALFTLFTRAITLPGASLGLQYYFTIEWDRFQDIGIWADATTQIFFAMSPCWGGIITLANMNKFHNNFHANTVLIVTINYLTSLFIGLITFAIVGHMSTYSGIALGDVVDSGIGFIFQVLPEAIAKLPLANINSALIFAILLFLGYLSQLTVIETVITTIVDTWPHKLRYRRPLVLMILCASMLLLSLFLCFSNGFYLIQTILETFAGTFTAMIIGVLELIAIAWVYGIDNFMQDIDDMISVHRNLFPSRTYWYFMWRYLTPSVLFAVLLFCLTDFSSMSYRQVEMPSWMDTVGWALTAVCVSTIPIIAFVRFLLAPQGSVADRISYLCRPSEDWAPSSYVSGPKLINRHEMLDDSDLMLGGSSLRTIGNHSGSSRNDGDDYDDGDDIDGVVTSTRGSGANRNKGSSDRGVGTVYANGRKRIPASGPYRDNVDGNDSDCNSNDEDLKLVGGKANYIIPEEEDDTDVGLITSETNV